MSLNEPSIPSIRRSFILWLFLDYQANLGVLKTDILVRMSEHSFNDNPVSLELRTLRASVARFQVCIFEFKSYPMTAFKLLSY
jgi:hypothetical protein